MELVKGRHVNYVSMTLTFLYNTWRILEYGVANKMVYWYSDSVQIFKQVVSTWNWVDCLQRSSMVGSFNDLYKLIHLSGKFLLVTSLTCLVEGFMTRRGSALACHLTSATCAGIQIPWRPRPGREVGHSSPGRVILFRCALAYSVK